MNLSKVVQNPRTQARRRNPKRRRKRPCYPLVTMRSGTGRRFHGSSWTVINRSHHSGEYAVALSCRFPLTYMSMSDEVVGFRSPMDTPSCHTWDTSRAGVKLSICLIPQPERRQPYPHNYVWVCHPALPFGLKGVAMHPYGLKESRYDHRGTPLLFLPTSRSNWASGLPLSYRQVVLSYSIYQLVNFFPLSFSLALADFDWMISYIDMIIYRDSLTRKYQKKSNIHFT